MTPWTGWIDGGGGTSEGEEVTGDTGVTPQVLPWLEPTLALRAVIICGRDLRNYIRTLELMC
jgi:hypothetical protein